MEQNAGSGGKSLECGFPHSSSSLVTVGEAQFPYLNSEIRWVSCNPKIQRKTKTLSQTASLQSSRDLQHRAVGASRTGRNPSLTTSRGPEQMTSSLKPLFSTVEMRMIK